VGVTPPRQYARRIRAAVDEPGLRASVAADVNAVVSTGSGTGAATQQVRVRQGRSTGTDTTETGETVTENAGLSNEELESAGGEQLPDREQMSLVNANIAVPVNAAVAANVLSDGAVAYADADQLAEIDQAN
jgi:hypothetical protein